MRSIAVMSMLMLMASASLIGQDDLREQVKKYGTVEVLVLHEYSPVDLPDLVSSAAVIARVVVTQAKSALIGSKVLTDYTAQVLAVSKGEPTLMGKIVTIRRPGGIVSLEGGTVKARDPDFPPFELGEEYVLFLVAEAENRYAVEFGAQGAFKVERGSVSQVSTDTGKWNLERGKVALSAFLNEIGAVRDKR